MKVINIEDPINLGIKTQFEIEMFQCTIKSNLNSNFQTHQKHANDTISIPWIPRPEQAKWGCYGTSEPMFILQIC